MQIGGDVVQSLAAPLVAGAEEPAAAEDRPPEAASQAEVVAHQPPDRARGAPQAVAHLPNVRIVISSEGLISVSS